MTPNAFPTLIQSAERGTHDVHVPSIVLRSGRFSKATRAASDVWLQPGTPVGFNLGRDLDRVAAQMARA